VFNNANLTVFDCNFTQNLVTGFGGAVYLESTAVAVLGSSASGQTIFASNSAAKGGGAFASNTVKVIVTTAGLPLVFKDNAGGGGGAALMVNSELQLGLQDPSTSVNVTFTGNNGGEKAGAINAISTLITVNGDVRFLNNQGDIGGAITLDSSRLTVYQALFANNNGTKGGAIYVSAASTLVIGTAANTPNSLTRFQQNTAEYGGAIYMEDVTGSMAAVCFTNNIATVGGGAVYDVSEKAFKMIAGLQSFGGNAAPSGPAMLLGNGTQLACAANELDSTVTSNAAGAYDLTGSICTDYAAPPTNSCPANQTTCGCPGQSVFDINSCACRQVRAHGTWGTHI
jgi:predicted outer membrane repeat protein